jgi:pimeloyl-ACP methyl ester carboxylesterase
MRWIQANGAVLRYELSGWGGPPLVLVHEMGGTLESWDAVAPVLARSRQVLRYDMRGSGLSEKVRGTLALGTLADDLAALMDRLGIAGPAVVAGCAVGAAVALGFTARYPDRVAGLVAMAPATGLPPDRQAATLARADRLDREGLRAVADPDSLPTGASPSDPAEHDRCRRLANDPHGVAALQRMLAGLAMDGDLARIRCPALVLAGRRDPYRPPDVVEKVARAIAGARLEVHDTGHVMPVDTPDLVIEVVERFWGEVAAGTV